ncbi:MAG TPA: efflux RND transporter permease subunit [Stellaceae bacterium]|nr:efflux RND transporter permease subunit [Stellaceae bacterium]
MWLVKIALTRPYTFIVLALSIFIISPIVILRTPVDIFPNINIPVIAIAWTYTGLNPEEMEGRITTVFERTLTTTVDNIAHIESTTVDGISIIKVFLQPTASLQTANAQVTAISQTLLRGLPPGTQPPLIINYSASSVPVLQLGLSGKGLSEQQLFDLGVNFLRTQLVTVPGAVIPFPFGGKQRQAMIYLRPDMLLAKGLSPSDVLNAVINQNLVLPSGTVKIGALEYDVRLNSAPRSIEELNALPIKVLNGSTVYLRDVATVSDGAPPQTNIVRQDGQRGVMFSVMKAGTASTIDVVNGIRALIPRILQTLPPALKVTPLGDQSIFVRAAVTGVIREAVIATALTAAMILIFLGSWRSTLIIAVSIPLSILGAVIVLGFLGETINIMTLGGLALAVGILVDNATVTIENIERHIEEESSDLNTAIMDGAAQIAVPSLVATLCICIVFLPMFFLNGVAKYLFVPLAEAVVFAMLWSYVLSRTLVATLAMYLLRAKAHDRPPSRNPLVQAQRAFESGFNRFRASYRAILTVLIARRIVFIPTFFIACLAAFLLAPWLGQDFFPNTDNGQMILHLRAKSGTRIEETAKLTDEVEGFVRHELPQGEITSILDDIGLPYSIINFTYSTSGLIGAGDADIIIALGPDHRPTADYVRLLRKDLPRAFPGTTFYFLPADIVSQILNFGIPAPIDVQIDGTDIDGNRKVADKMLNEVRQVPGIVDARIQQQFDYPDFNIAVDRTKAAETGLTERDVANSVVNILSGSNQVSPMFFLNPENGVNYNLTAEAPQYDMESLQNIANIPVSTNGQNSQILGNLATIGRGSEMQVISHYNIRRVIDVYASVQDRDLGAVGQDIARIVDANRSLLPRGSFVTVRGQIETMRSSYVNLLGGLAFSIVLVYLLIVVNFQSWLDPFIIITALPAALAGIVLFLFFTQTTLSVPALMGAIMCMGVATANSILVVSFARERLAVHGDAVLAAIEAAYTRLRPVLMTALAMIIGMIPMALGLGEGGEENAPLGRAVIGGLILATVATLVFVPCVFSLLHHRGKAKPQEMA